MDQGKRLAVAQATRSATRIMRMTNDGEKREALREHFSRFPGPQRTCTVHRTASR